MQKMTVAHISSPCMQSSVISSSLNRLEIVAGKNSNSNCAGCTATIKESESNEARDEGNNNNVQQAAGESCSGTVKRDKFGMLHNEKSKGDMKT